MKKILGLVLFVMLACPVHAGGFYKWRDADGVLHITDHPPDEAVESEVDSETRINKAPMGQRGSGSRVQIQDQGQGLGRVQGNLPEEDKALQDTINRVKSEIAYLESQKRMDPSMERAGLRSDIRRKQEMLQDLYLEESGVSKAEIALRRMQEKERRISTALSFASKPVLTGPQGQVYIPGAAGNYINTGTGAVMLPQGGNNYLNTQTGRIVTGN
ncbi:hypothetical protein H4684_002630 [Desulfomicrobium macestii]|uniref:DUF4124 domain-containing protein n=1 Tax=Desulfomicrobium macestii TaxID=90731 RepID=A0ABR9H5J2_9BACT|nr:DUF4124 domain-containing protein [Desulfomicrobium macestii]MBE1425971.1 hypothetical protein [Desulfomicrobium macestii]